MLPVVLFGFGLAVVIELLCCLFRFAFKLRSREIQRRWIGVRLHHGYIAAPMLVSMPLVPASWPAWFLAVAIAMVASDLFHHFVVLPLATGQRD